MNQRDKLENLDCLVIGAGPAGLTAAIYLARFCRSVAVIDAGESRLKKAPLAHNIPGFPEGISGWDLLIRMRRQAAQFGVVPTLARVSQLDRRRSGFQATTREGAYFAKTILLATGNEETDPEMEGVEDAVGAGLIRYCPVCDGYEAMGRNIAVIGGLPQSIGEAHFLRTFTSKVTYVPASVGGVPSVEARLKAQAAGIVIADGLAKRLTAGKHSVQVELVDGSILAFDCLYTCLGSRPRSELAASLGAAVSPAGGLLVDEHRRSNVLGLYAAGDVLEGLDQVSAACGHAVIAAMAIHNDLPREEPE